MRKAKAICMTTDSATAFAGTSFQCVTATLLQEDKLVTYCIQLSNMGDASHTADRLMEFLDTVVEEIRGTKPFLAIVTDQGSNIVKGTTRDFQQRTRVELVHRCICHKIHLSVTAVVPCAGASSEKKRHVFDKMETALQKARSFVSRVTELRVLSFFEWGLPVLMYLPIYLVWESKCSKIPEAYCG